MKRFKNVLFFALILVSQLSIAQRTPAEALFQIIGSLTTLEAPNDKVVGSQYVNSEFSYAQFSDYDKDFLMRYNAYKDIMEVKVNDSVFALPKNLNYEISFRYPEKTYKLFQYNNSNQVKTGLFVVVKAMPTNSLLRKEIVEIVPEHMPKNGFDPYKPASFKRVSDVFYVGYKNNTAEELPSAKKDILLLFGEKASIVESQVKKMKWNFKNNDDLVEIFNYYYSLK